MYEYSIKVRHRLYLTVPSLSFSRCSPQSHCKNEKERVRAKAERERQKQAQAQQRERKKQQKAQRQQQQRNAPQGSSSSIPLPPGWTQLRDPKTGRFYYVCAGKNGDRRTQWDRPRNPQYNGHTVAFPQVPRAQGVNGCQGSAGCTGAPAQKCQFKCCGNCCTGRKGRASASGKCSRHKRGR